MVSRHRAHGAGQQPEPGGTDGGDEPGPLAAAQPRGHGAEDALYEASDAVKNAVVEAWRQLPEAGMTLEHDFSNICREIMVRRIDERLVYIRRATEQTAGAFDLTEETRQLLTERVELLALKKRVLEELRPSSGTKAPMQPV